MKTKRKFGLVHSAGMSAVMLMGLSVHSQAADFQIGEVEAQFDSSLSLGAIWSTQSPDADLIGEINDGDGGAAVGDDGRLNFRSGDMVSNVFKGVHDLDIRWENSGAFIRGNYWYDFELKDRSQRLKDVSDDGRLQAAQSSGAQILDAFVYHNYDAAGMSGSARLGKQVVSWGESTFIPNSINSINPINLTALRRPGAELKEALIPVNMAFVSHSFNDAFSVEAFYQLNWREIVVDNCGTFFSGTDLIAKGCDRAVIAGGGDLDPSSQVFIPRIDDREPSDNGQFGVALKWYAEALNSTEFGLYAMNYHNRAPSLSAIRVDGSAPVPGDPGLAVSSRYFVDYAEDIELYGLSFQTFLNATGTSIGGEISHRPDMPMQINGNDLVGATMTPPGAGATSSNPLFVSGYAPSGGAGEEITGYVMKPFTQAQLTAVHIFGSAFGSSRLVVIGEVGVSHIDDLDSANGENLRFGRDTVFGNGPLIDGSCGGNSKCTTDGFYTDTSWGYRVRGNLEYPNAIAGVSLTPSLSLSHDVHGYGPTFNEGSKAVGIGIGASYRYRYNANISYTDFFGGDFNPRTDRDFVSLSFGVDF